MLDLGCGTGRLLAALEPRTRRRRRLQPGDDRQSRARNIRTSNSSSATSRIRADLDAARGPVRRDRPVGHDRLAGGLPGDVRVAASPLHAATRASSSRTTRSSGSRCCASASALGVKMPARAAELALTEDIANLLELADFEVVKREWRQLVPRSALLGLGTLVNRYVAPLAGHPPRVPAQLRRRPPAARSRSPARAVGDGDHPLPQRARQHRGGRAAPAALLRRHRDHLRRRPQQGRHARGDRAASSRPIPQLRHQGDACRTARARATPCARASTHARGDVLMILDADLTTPPESMPKFYDAIASGKGEFINGIAPRLSDGGRGDAVPEPHRQPRVLAGCSRGCSTSASPTRCAAPRCCSEADYEQIAASRAYFGDFDPFGDFDLIFGAAKLNLKVVEMPGPLREPRDMARRRSRASGTAGCCCAWWCSRSAS